MHFPIYQIVDDENEAKAGITADYLYEDTDVMYNTSHVGDEYKGKDRELAIMSLRAMLRGVAEVDSKKEAITYLDEDTIRKTLADEAEKALKRITTRLMDNNPFRSMRFEGMRFRGYLALINETYGTYTTGQWIEDAPYRAGKTYYIGSIFDAHI